MPTRRASVDMVGMTVVILVTSLGVWHREDAVWAMIVV